MAALIAVAFAGAASAPASAAECSNNFPSAFAAIQKVVFEGRGGTSAFCHDASASGGLDLTADVAFDDLVGVPSQTVPGWTWVRVGEKDNSLLFINVVARTSSDSFTAPLRAMPLGALPALSTNELAALRKLIEAGAPRDATVAGTADLLDACLPPPEPIQIDPLPPPAPGEACSATTTQQQNASCDSADGAGDGMCDACPLFGGVTTEDEMFILLGSFFVQK